MADKKHVYESKTERVELLMPPHINGSGRLFGGKLMVIRPLMLVEKKLISKAVKQWDLPVWSNPCPSAGHTRRSDIMQDLDTLCVGHKNRRKNIVNGLCRWQLEATLKGLAPADGAE
mgnify:CR=1 FL=1